MGSPGEGMTASLALRTNITKNIQKARFAITDITKQELMKLLKEFNNSLYLGYNNKQIRNKPTNDYFFLIKRITKLIKSKRHV